MRPDSSRGCIADEGKSGCNDTGIDALDGASAVAVSPDGTSVYVTSNSDDSLSVYSRNAVGDVFFRGCIADAGRSGCNDTGIDPLDGATSVTVAGRGPLRRLGCGRLAQRLFARRGWRNVFFWGWIADVGKSVRNTGASTRSTTSTPSRPARTAGPSTRSRSSMIRSASIRAMRSGTSSSGLDRRRGKSGCNDTCIDSLEGASSVTRVRTACPFTSPRRSRTRSRQLPRRGRDVFFLVASPTRGIRVRRHRHRSPGRRQLGRGQSGRNGRLRSFLRERLDHSLRA